MVLRFDQRILSDCILSQNFSRAPKLYLPMNELLENPVVQAGVAPFVLALIVAALLHRTRLIGLAIGAGFAAVIVMAIGFSFEPLTAVRKMVLSGAGACLLLLVLELLAVSRGIGIRIALALAEGAAGIWVILRVLQQQDTGPAMLAALGAAAYMAALVDGGNDAGTDPIGAAASSLMLGLGSGVLAWLGASAALAQIGIAIGAAAGGVLLIQMVTGRRPPLGWTLALPASTTAGMVCLLSVFTASLPWYCLIPTLAIPWAPRLYPRGKSLPVWITAFLMASLALIPMLVAVALAWTTASASPT